jgi:hypothetical protein
MDGGSELDDCPSGTGCCGVFNAAGVNKPLAKMACIATSPVIKAAMPLIITSLVSAGAALCASLYATREYLPIYEYNNVFAKIPYLASVSFVSYVSYNVGANKDWIYKNLPNGLSIFGDHKADDHHHDAILANQSSYKLLNPFKSIRGADNFENIINAGEDGSRMFGGKGNVNTMTGATNKSDGFYFSMCGNKIKNISGVNKISTNYNFEKNLDKIFIFCTKKSVSMKDLEIAQVEATDNNPNHSLIKYTNPTNSTDISLMAFVDVVVDQSDIVFNCKWDDAKCSSAQESNVGDEFSSASTTECIECNGTTSHSYNLL